MGRPQRELTPEEYSVIEECSKRGMSKDEIAGLLRISPTTFREIEGRDGGKLTDALSYGKSNGIYEVSGHLLKHTKRYVEATKYYLNSKAGWTQDNLQGLNHAPVTINIVKPDGID